MISIIDDDRSVREAIKSLVRSLGYDAVTFASAEDYLESDCIRDSECLITDVHMPGMTSLIRQARAQPFCQPRPPPSPRDVAHRNGRGRVAEHALRWRGGSPKCAMTAPNCALKRVSRVLFTAARVLVACQTRSVRMAAALAAGASGLTRGRCRVAAG